METLKHTLEQARAGHGQIVAALAEPGVGKSRLFHEFKAVSQSGCMVLEALSVSHGKASAYLPVIDLLHTYFKIVADDDQRTRREKVNGRIMTLDPALEDTGPYLFGLLGLAEGDDPPVQMEGQVKKRRTLEAIKRILLRESLNQPLMLTFEDLHWIDEQTQEFINLLADSIGTAKILLLVSYRPEYSHQWNSKTYYTQLRLDPLGRENAAEMLSALLGNSEGLNSLKRLIIEKTEGTPFFMEETVQVLFDEGALLRNGATHLTRPLEQLKIPPTVQAILASRIDRLSLDAKDLLQTLAVIGSEFPLSLIRAVITKSDGELNNLLSDLQFGEFIYEQPAVGDTEYIFKHALTQEVAYNSVLVERRKQLHERAAAAMESMFANQLDDHLDELARHYSRSDNLRKAVEYLGRAGARAAQHVALSDAVDYSSRALELLKRLPPGVNRDRQEVDLLNLFLFNLYFARGPAALAEAEAGALRALELGKQLGDDARLTTVLIGLTAFYVHRNELTKAQEFAQQTLALTEPADPGQRAEAHQYLGIVLYLGGDFDSARKHLARALEYTDWERGYRTSGQLASIVSPTVSLLLGYPAAARREGRESVASARRLSDPVDLARALVYDAIRHALLRDSGSTLERADEALSIATEHALPVYQTRASFWRGWAMAAAGQSEDGISEMRRCLAVLTSGGALVPLFAAMLAASYGKSDYTEEGLAAVDEALRRLEHSGERMAEAELHRIRGELLMMRDPPDDRQAERSFRTAIEIARRHKARWWGLRATVSFSRLLKRLGKTEKARTALTEIYNWFTEGFDTADLKDAKALLDELGA
jgi:tetratricopeptide (TPR) repeat protein